MPAMKGSKRSIDT